jgi:diguanylate cyclase (GGDEF)-like protein
MAKTFKTTPQPGASCFIDTNDYTVLFLNNSAAQAIGEDYQGKICYKYFYDLDSPCAFCPLKSLKQKGGANPFTWYKYDASSHGGLMLEAEKCKYENKDAAMIQVKAILTNTEADVPDFSSQDRILAEAEKSSLSAILSLLSSSKAGESRAAMFETTVQIIQRTYQADKVFVGIDQKAHGGFYYVDKDNLACPESLRKEGYVYSQMALDKFSKLRNASLLTPDETALILPAIPEKSELKKIMSGSAIYLIILNAPLSESKGGALFMLSPKLTPRQDGFFKMIVDLLNFFFMEVKQEEAPEFSPDYDAMTKVKNANAFMEMKIEMRENPPSSLGVVFADINGLKYTNDNYDHELGDSMIIATANVLMKVFPRDYIFRVGGDEFLAIEIGQTVDGFKKDVNRLRRNLLTDKSTSVSIGTAFGEGANVSLPKLVGKADKEMYAEKNFYYDLVRQSHAAQDKISVGTFEATVSKALSEGQIKMNLYPRFNRDMKVVEFDGGISILSPIANITDPTVLIETTEKIGFSTTVDFFVVKEACLFQKKMLKKYGKTVPIAINFSRSAFLEKDFPDRIEKIVDTYQIPHNLIEIMLIHLGRDMFNEITDFAVKIHEKGFLLSLNHFGIGDANLSILGAADFDSIKLASYLVPSLMTENGQKVLTTILTLCHELKTVPIFDYLTENWQFEKAQELGFEVFRGPALCDRISAEEAESKFYADPNKSLV